MEIRLRTEADVPALLAALKATHEVDRYPVLPNHVSQQWLLEGDDGVAWVADLDGDVVGHVAVADDDRNRAALSVHRLFVAPKARGFGLASALLTTVETYAEVLGDDLYLEVVAHNTDAISLYERRGWQRYGSYTATWSAPDGTHPVIYLYGAPKNTRGASVEIGAGSPVE